jgi:hypothetical protein
MIKNAVTTIPVNIVMTPQILPSELAITTSCIFIPIAIQKLSITRATDCTYIYCQKHQYIMAVKFLEQYQ